MVYDWCYKGLACNLQAGRILIAWLVPSSGINSFEKLIFLSQPEAAGGFSVERIRDRHRHALRKKYCKSSQRRTICGHGPLGSSKRKGASRLGPRGDRTHVNSSGGRAPARHAARPPFLSTSGRSSSHRQLSSTPSHPTQPETAPTVPPRLPPSFPGRSHADAARTPLPHPRRARDPPSASVRT